jgi:hypothetical protein
MTFDDLLKVMIFNITAISIGLIITTLILGLLSSKIEKDKEKK